MSQFFINLDRQFVERFDMARFMRYTDNLDPLTSTFFDELIKLPVFGQFKVEAEENRLDIISFKIYRTTKFWWVVALYNNFFEVETPEIGQVLDYPSQDSIEDLFLRLRARESAQG